jgi:predicted enzyme related to lactoylglutathione lyase
MAVPRQPMVAIERQTESSAGTSKSMSTKGNPVGWFEIYVQDIARAKAFYEKTFQVTLSRLESPGVELWAFPMEHEAAGCPGALVKMAGKDSGVGGTIVYFTCADCAVEAERAARNGGKIQRPKFAIGQYGFIALILDPEGNMIGLHSMQ